MAKTPFSAKKHDINTLNSGYQYTTDDQMSIEALNNTIENSFYASNIAEDVAEQLSNLGTDDKIEFKGSNTNLLINGDFRVNQRGQGSYTLASGFCVDTWYYAHSQITKLEKGVNVHIINAWGNFAQVIENAQSFAGKTITASAKISNFQQFGNAGNIKLFIVVNKSLKIQGSALITKDGTYTITSTIPDITITELKVMIANYSGVVIDTSFDVEWVKLEIGLIATAFSPRPYAEEFNNCQRYLQVKSSAFAFETKGIDRSPAMREDGTVSTIVIENVSYNIADAEIKPL